MHFFHLDLKIFFKFTYNNNIKYNNLLIFVPNLRLRKTFIQCKYTIYTLYSKENMPKTLTKNPEM